jgi:hypothetical protein
MTTTEEEKTTTATTNLEPGETSPEFRGIIVDDMIGYVSSIGLKALVVSNHEIYDEVLSSDPLALDKKRIKRVAECELVLSPTTLRAVHTFLGKKLKEYEAYFGEIPTSEKFEARKKEYLRSKGPDDLESLR